MNNYTQYRLFEWPKLKAGEFSAGLSETGSRLGYPAENMRVSILGRLKDGTNFHRELKYGDDIDAICDLKPLNTTVHFKATDSLPNLKADLQRGHYEHEFKIIVSTEKAILCQRTLDAFESALSLNTLHDSQAKNESNNSLMKSQIINRSLSNGFMGASQNKLSVPEKVTLKWLYSNVPFKFWSMLIGLLISSFILGVSSARLSIVREWFGIVCK